MAAKEVRFANKYNYDVEGALHFATFVDISIMMR